AARRRGAIGVARGRLALVVAALARGGVDPTIAAHRRGAIDVARGRLSRVVAVLALVDDAVATEWIGRGLVGGARGVGGVGRERIRGRGLVARAPGRGGGDRRREVVATGEAGEQRAEHHPPGCSTKTD